MEEETLDLRVPTTTSARTQMAPTPTSLLVFKISVPVFLKMEVVGQTVLLALPLTFVVRATFAGLLPLLEEDAVAIMDVLDLTFVVAVDFVLLLLEMVILAT